MYKGRQVDAERSACLHKRGWKWKEEADAPFDVLQDQEEWKPLALMVAEFEASTPARFNNAGPRAMQYVPPPQPAPNERPQVCPCLCTPRLSCPSGLCLLRDVMQQPSDPGHVFMHTIAWLVRCS
jgi:hypothetical protein